ncbi:hypothetical protein ACGFI9_21820 [Micromonospora sp. NPDC048930]|uniref:hypothetical protein n=1 Tax=Micromonospora sp. NPDC048930 TaxID=3364261 RepID=UPI0037173710
MTTNNGGSKTPRAAKAPRAGAFGAFSTATPPVAPPPAAAEQPPAQAAPTPAPAPSPAQPAPDHGSQAAAGGAPEAAPARDLTSYLGGGQDGDGGGAGFVRAMLAGPPVDPMLDLVQLGASVPRHYQEALRLLSFAQRRHKQALVIDALTAYIGPQLLAEALAAVQTRR